MKNKIFNLIILLLISLTGSAQLVSGTLLSGSSPNSVIVALRSTAAFSNPFTNVQFVLQIPNDIHPTPQVNIKNNFLEAYMPTAGYNFSSVDSATLIAFSNEGGYYNYLFSTVVLGGASYNFTTSPFNVLELDITGGRAVMRTVRFAQLPDGGMFGQHNFYIETNTGDHTNELSMFFGGAPVNSPQGYGGYSYIPLPGVVVPINWLSFNAYKNGNDALLDWSVANDEKNHHYDLQRSLDGINFISIKSIDKNSNKNYKYTDVGIVNLGASLLYYRVKQVDFDGKYSYSEIRNIRLTDQGAAITIYPNPVTKGFYVNISKVEDVNEMMVYNLYGSNGQLVASRQIKGLQATNYYFDLKDLKLAAGQYSLQVMQKDIMIAGKQLTINQ